MLQAKSIEGVIITLAELSRKEIELERQKKFYCPTCNEQVIIKAGHLVVPHFAHRSKANCQSGESGEGPYHEKGKIILYRWLASQQLNVELEKYIEEINQRPDLFLQINNQKIAVEFQCARVPIKQIIDRNIGYKQANIIPIWILGANRFKRKTKNKLNIDQYTLQFIHQFSTGFSPILFFFCPNTMQFVTFQHIYFTQTGQAYGNFTFDYLNQIHFLDIFKESVLSKRSLYTTWKKEKKILRLKPRGQLYGQQLAWHQWLYLKRTHIEFLSSIIYLPISAQWKMKSPPWDWQSRLVIDLLDRLPLQAHFSLKECRQLLYHHLHDRNLFPLINSSDCPIKQYLFLLEKLNILKKHSPNNFIKINPVQTHRNIENALNSDKIVMNRLIAMT